MNVLRDVHLVHPVSLAVLLLACLLTGCSKTDDEPENLAPPVELPAEESMSSLEQTSFEAIRTLQRCLAPKIEEAKRQERITDEELLRLGYRCPRELRAAATALADRADFRSYDLEYSRLSHAQKISRNEAELAEIGFCKIRPCQTM